MIAILFFLVVVTWLLAGLTLQLFAPSQTGIDATKQIDLSPVQSSKSSINWNSYQLFGKEMAATATVEKQRPEATTQESSKILKQLGIKLIGVVASSNPENSYIAISDKGNVDIYRTNDEIRDGVTIDEIKAKEIVLSLDGVTEVISLIEGDPGAKNGIQPVGRQQSPGASATGRSNSFRVSNPQIRERLDDYRAALRDDPASLIGKIRTAAVMRDGKIYGQRLRSGSDRQLLTGIGLRSGDILLSVNGIQMNDIGNIGRVIDSLATSDNSVQLEIERGGRVQALDVVLGQ